MTKPKPPKPHRFTGRNGKTAADGVKRFGREVACYNHGWLNGHDNGKARGYVAGFERAVMLMMGNGVRWTSAERRLGNRITRKLFGKKR